jgi:hypothetical protein
MTACQRWSGGQPSWVRPDRFSFNPAHYDIRELLGPGCDTITKGFVRAHHYLGTYPNAKLRYGLYEHSTGKLVGVAVLAIPVQPKILTGVFPRLLPGVESLELARFVLLDRVPANAESWFLARVRALASIPVDDGGPGLKGLVADSDPMPRSDATGRTITPGHIGIIYQASSARFCGRSGAYRLAVLPDGTVFSRRAMQKVRKGEQGHRYAEDQLIRHGAQPRRGGQPGAAWLATALPQARVTWVGHPGNLRYGFPLGPTARTRARVLIAPSAGPYPKPELTLY